MVREVRHLSELEQETGKLGAERTGHAEYCKGKDGPGDWQREEGYGGSQQITMVLSSQKPRKQHRGIVGLG